MTTHTIEVNVTEKECHIVKLLADGYSIPEIADWLKSNRRTLEAKVSALKKKYNSATLASLVATFLRNKLID